MKVKTFIKKNCVLHTRAEYSDKFKNLQMTNVKFDKQLGKGVYFFVVEGDGIFDVQKVGKADGARGFYARFAKYKMDYRKAFKLKVMDAPVLFEGFTQLRKKYGKDVSINVYIHEMSTVTVDYHGVEVQTSMIRSFEHAMSKLARQQGHSMFLSKCA